MSPQMQPDPGQDLAHDLNNIFQTIVHAAYLISCGEDRLSNAEIITRSVEQARCLLGLAGDGETAPLVEIAGSAIECVRDFNATHGGPKLTIGASVDPAIRLSRPREMRRALINLLMNAVQAAEGAGRTAAVIHVEGRSHDGMVVLKVRDNGPGIPAQMLPVIFKPTFAPRTGAEGLGLHIVETAVRDYGGTITAANAESGGAQFTIRLPERIRS